MKKIFSVIMALLIAASVLCFGFNASALDYKTGDKLLFGTYPQSEVKDEERSIDLGYSLYLS